MNHTLMQACFYIFIAAIAVMLAFAAAPAFNSADDSHEAMSGVPSVLQMVLFQSEHVEANSAPTSVKAVLSR